MLFPPKSLDHEEEKTCVCSFEAGTNFYEIFLLVIVCLTLRLHAGLKSSIKKKLESQKTQTNQRGQTHDE